VKDCVDCEVTSTVPRKETVDGGLCSNKESAVRNVWLSLYHNCDSTTIQRYHDIFDYDGSDRNYVLRLIRLRYVCNTTTMKN